ncbi:CidA/LrgA family protein [Marinicella sediminis]|nr:CidA/LrgA family protein [Marinicella sediminis]
MRTTLTMKRIAGVLILIVYHQLGEWLVRLAGWTLPGAVVGMLLFFLTLLALRKPPEMVTVGADFLLRHLALLFVPAGVGVVLLLELIRDQWLAMLVSLVISTVLSMLFTGWLMQLLMPKEHTPHD